MHPKNPETEFEKLLNSLFYKDGKKFEGIKPVYSFSAINIGIKRVIYHDPATIVFWTDGTKTVVKCMEGQQYEKYAGFCAALAKKIYGSTSKAKKISGAKG